MTPTLESKFPEKRADFARLRSLICAVLGACLLTSCATTEQVNERKVSEANQSVDSASGSELSPPLKVLNFLGQLAAPSASYHGSF